MVRGGYIKNVANGVYSQYPPMNRISRKIEEIIRDEMEELQGETHAFSRYITKVTGANVQMLADEQEAVWLQRRRQHHRELGVASPKSWVLNKS